MSVLTSGHFLMGDSLRALPDRDETATPLSSLWRWRRANFPSIFGLDGAEIILVSYNGAINGSILRVLVFR